MDKEHFMQKKTIFLTAMLVVVLALVFVGCPGDGNGDGGYVIGDAGPAGGIIFYVKTSASDGWQYLEAAPSDISGMKEWSSTGYENTLITDAQGMAIGTGKSNTVAILTVDPDAPAAKACADYSSNGYSDWFLPSKDELNAMYHQKTVIGNFEPDFYWSSSELNSSENEGILLVCGQAFGDLSATWGPFWVDGAQGDDDKIGEWHRVRPVRAF
jgi:hypothetical protein